MVRFFAKGKVQILLSALILFGCSGGLTPQEEFVEKLKADKAAGFSFQKIVQKIQDRDYPGVFDPFDEVRKGEPVDENNFDFEAYVKEQEQFISDIKDRTCPGVLKKLEKEKGGPGDIYYFLDGVFYEEGICREKNSRKAFEIYQASFNYYAARNVSARLGNLYFRGLGVEKDLEKANYYFDQAVMNDPGVFWVSREGSGFTSSPDDLGVKFWGATREDMINGFFDEFTGPWALPHPLVERVAWIRNLDGPEAFEIATNMLKGQEGYDKNPDLAFIWFEQAGDFLSYPKAKFESLLMRISEDYCPTLYKENPNLDCKDFNDTGFLYMGEEALTGNRLAYDYLSKYFETAPQTYWSSWDQYLLFLAAQEEGFEFDKNRYERVEGSLEDFEKNLLEAWFEERFYGLISSYLPS